MSLHTSRSGGESNPSFDSRSEDGRRGPGEGIFVVKPDRVSVPSKDATMSSRRTGTESSGSARHGGYDLDYPDKVEYSCDEAGSWQKLSFLLLLFAFVGHGIAVCIPYWVVAYDGDQMSLYEGVWLSCVRQNRDLGSWFCSTFSTVRKQRSSPGWYQAAQVCAFLSLVLLIPALVAASLYSFVVALRGRTRASWVLLSLLVTSGVLSFLSIVIYGGGYDMDQQFLESTGRPRFHASFALQIISFCVIVTSIATHVKDIWGRMTIWDNKDGGASGLPAGVGVARFVPGATAKGFSYTATARPSSKLRVPSFNLPSFPATAMNFLRLSKKGRTSSAPPSKGAATGSAAAAVPPSKMATEELEEEPRGVIGSRERDFRPTAAAKSGVPSTPKVAYYESYGPPVNESFRSHDSQV